MRPPLGPRRVLWVVEVTKSAYGTGEGCIHHEISPDFVRDGAELVELDGARVRRRARDDELGLIFESFLPDVVVVYPARLGVEPVRDEPEELAAEVDGRAVGEVPALGEGHAEHGIAGLQHRIVDRKVGIGAAVRLDVGEFDAEEFLRALDRKFLRAVDELTSAVIALAGITLRILVGVETACRRHDCGRDDVFACDEFEVVLLTAELLHHGTVKFGIHRTYALEVYHIFSFEVIFVLTDAGALLPI